ncbi:unnamed protein product, partial [marine sediment metagenome]
LTAVQNAKLSKAGNKTIQLTWDTAYAGDHPIKWYEIWRNDTRIGEVEHKPQVSLEPFRFEDSPDALMNYEYKVVTVDTKNNKAETESLVVV